jgi:hypothetical protein
MEDQGGRSAPGHGGKAQIIPFPVRNCTIAKAIGGGRRPPLQCKSKLETV